MDLESRLHRLERAVGLQPILPSVDSLEFQMRYICFPAIFGADGMTDKDKAVTMALNPLDYAEGYDRDIVTKAQENIIKCKE